LINMAHPLLKQGLVVLDTPGLNAIGAEPELTVNLIAQAQAVVFVLGADTGVTRSDLAIWQEHLAPARSGIGAQLVVLNKIDALWDGLRTPEQIEAEIARQCASTAQTLHVDADQVVALSAQKGLLAKVRGEAALLQDSRLPAFEALLARMALGERQQALEQAVHRGLERLQADALRVIGVQRREWVEQVQELKGLRGKNHAVIRHMRRRVEGEKQTFDRSAAGVLAVRSVHVKLLREVFALLSSASIKSELAGLSAALREPGLKLGVRKVYAEGFDRLRAVVRRVTGQVGEIDAMLGSAFRTLNTEHGFSLQVPPAPDLHRLESELAAVEQSHVQYLGVGNLLHLVRAEFTDKLIRSLFARVRAIFETAVGEIELWNKAASGQLDVELRERRRAFSRRIETIQRIQDAASNLDSRLAELDQQLQSLQARELRLGRMVRELQSSVAPARSGQAVETALA
ncbi:MAG TPA: dynamin family protein, partial [Ottowia sp.]|nr:dynamin family protein [Ottowia sp.]